MPQIKKGFALSTADFYEYLKPVPDEKTLISVAKDTIAYPNYVALNSTTLETFLSIYKDLSYYNLATDINALKDKRIIMLDEDQRNKGLAETIKINSPIFFDYQVWDTDHGFTNKRASLMNIVLSFLDK